jgi:hypothetical protein
MRRVVAVLVVASLVGSLGVSARAEKIDDDDHRTTAAKYVASAGTSAAPSLVWSRSPVGNVGAVEFRVKGNEHFISVDVRDASGLPVHGEIAADLDDVEQTSEMIADFCGRTKAPVELPDVGSVQIIVRSGSCGGGPALATSGRVKVRFSAIPER